MSFREVARVISQADQYASPRVGFWLEQVSNETYLMADFGELKLRGLRPSVYAWLLGLAWTCAVVASLLWSVRGIERSALESARIQARAGIEKDVLYRRWNANHGGVYVKVSEACPPNEYLDVEERDIVTPKGKRLTLVNPAYMVRQIHELGNREQEVMGHITSLRPIRPANRADGWETESMQAFERGVDEVSTVTQINGRDYVRLMRPLRTEQGCLKCHAAQGHQLGDLRGGLSIAVPLGPLQQARQGAIHGSLVGHGIFWLLGIGGVIAGYRSVHRRLSERAEFERSIWHLNDVLRAVRSVSQMTAQHLEPEPMVKAVCRVLIEARGYLSAWIVLVDDEHRPTIRAHAGYGAGTQHPCRETDATDLPDCARAALDQEGVRLFEGRCRDCRMGDELNLCGQHQTMAVRLAHHDRVFGVLVATAATTAVDDEELRLFRGMGDDIARGLDHAETSRQRLEAEQSLRTTEEHFRSFFDLLPQTVFETDLSGRILFANRSAFERFGYEPGDLEKGITVFDMIVPEDHERARASVRKVLVKNEGSGNQYTMRCRDGSTFPAVIHSGPVVEDGKPLGLRGIVVDLSEQKHVEDRLKKTVEELERFNQIAIGREHRMIELKEQVNELATIAGVERPYDLSFVKKD